MITKEDIEGLKVPVTMACTGQITSLASDELASLHINDPQNASWRTDHITENDQLFPDDVRAEGQKYLVDKEIPHEIQVFPGVPHGQYLSMFLLFLNGFSNCSSRRLCCGRRV